MTETEAQLLRVIAERSFKKGDFTLASGAKSTYYIDGRMTAVHSAGAHLIGQALYDRTKDLAFDAIGGLAVGAVPLTTAAVIHYHLNGREMEGFWVRSEEKKHGMKKLVEGGLKPNARVVIVDDVITSGGSSLQAADAVQAMGCEVVRVIALVDRLQGAAEAFRARGLDFRPVFTIRDLGVDVPARG